MDYAYSPYLPEDMTWEDLFELVIVESRNRDLKAANACLRSVTTSCDL